jgi:hypothetical protein
LWKELIWHSIRKKEKTGVLNMEMRRNVQQVSGKFLTGSGTGFYEITASGSHSDTCGQTDIKKLILAFAVSFRKCIRKSG